VVYVDDRPEGFAFAYGTLPGHPECGEVAFRVDRSTSSDEIFFRIASFSARIADRTPNPDTGHRALPEHHRRSLG